MGLGEGTDNFVELRGLKILLVFAIEKNILSLQFFWGSQLVTKWINGLYICHNQRIQPLVDEIICLKYALIFFSTSHVYKEHNKIRDTPSKEGILMARGTWMITKTQNDLSYEFYHRPFIDGNNTNYFFCFNYCFIFNSSLSNYFTWFIYVMQPTHK